MTRQQRRDISWTPATTCRLDETSIRYDGWRIVVVCFLLATFGWGLGFYGQSVYVAELQRLHGWPASLISSGTTFFYLFGAALVAFVSEAIKAFGPRNCLIAGICAMAVAAIAIGQVREPWQLYLANAVLAFGWAGTSLGMITNTLGLWFDKKRGMAISLALNGASFGGIIGVPLLVAAIGHFGFSGAMTAVGRRDGRADGSGDPAVRRTAAGSCERGRRRGRGRAVADADSRPGVSRYRLPLGVDGVRAGAVRAGRLHRPPDLVSGFGDRAASRRRLRWRC